MEVLFREGYHEHPQNGGDPDEAFDPEADDPQNGVSEPAYSSVFMSPIISFVRSSNDEK